LQLLCYHSTNLFFFKKNAKYIDSFPLGFSIKDKLSAETGNSAYWRYAPQLALMYAKVIAEAYKPVCLLFYHYLINLCNVVLVFIDFH